MNAVLTAPSAVPFAPLDGIPGQGVTDRGSASTTTALAGHPLSEALVIACVLAEHGAPHKLGPCPDADHVRRVLLEHLNDRPHLDTLSWMARTPGGDLAWRMCWTNACAAVAACYPELPSAGELPPYAGRSTLPA